MPISQCEFCIISPKYTTFGKTSKFPTFSPFKISNSTNVDNCVVPHPFLCRVTECEWNRVCVAVRVLRAPSTCVLPPPPSLLCPPLHDNINKHGSPTERRPQYRKSVLRATASVSSWRNSVQTSSFFFTVVIPRWVNEPSKEMVVL